MNWLALLFKLVPYVVAGIEMIHGDQVAGSTKKQMAMDALGVATQAALTGVPNQATAVQVSAALTSQMIDGVVAFNNATGLFNKKTGATATATAVLPKKA